MARYGRCLWRKHLGAEAIEHLAGQGTVSVVDSYEDILILSHGGFSVLLRQPDGARWNRKIATLLYMYGNGPGLEDGIVVRRADGTLSMIAAEMYEDPKWVAMQLGVHTSADGLAWHRKHHLRRSTGHTKDGNDQHAATWGQCLLPSSFCGLRLLLLAHHIPSSLLRLRLPVVSTNFIGFKKEQPPSTEFLTFIFASSASKHAPA